MNARSLPLKGQHVLITRGGEQGEKFCMDVATNGGIPYMVPLIDFRAHQDPNKHYFIQNLPTYDWIIFTSKNGVHHFFEQIKDKVDEHIWENNSVQFAVVGEKTQQALSHYKRLSRFMPKIYTAEDFATDFFQQGISAHKVLIAKGNLASNTIAKRFRSKEIIADEWIVYDTYYPTRETEKLIRLLRDDLLTVAAFSSPSTFNHFMKIVNEHHLSLHAKKLVLAAIGTVTKRTIEHTGYHAEICPETFTIDDMFQAICDYFEKQEQEGKK